MKILRILTIGVMLSLCCCYACLALSLNVDPSSISVITSPGEERSGEMVVSNTGSTPVRISVYTRDWVYAPDGSKTFLPTGSSVNSCSGWIKLDISGFSLAPKEEKKVTYTISTPKNSTGGHVSVIFFEGAVEKVEGIAVTGRIGTIVYQDIEGEIKRNGELKDLNVYVSRESTPMITVKFQNKGNTRISVKPILSILKDGKPVIETSMRAINTLPGDEGISKITIPDPLNEGDYKAVVEINLNDKTLKTQSDFTIKK